MKFVIIHGSFGNPSENWFPSLAASLENLGQEVIVPQFPVDDWDEVTKNGPGAPTKNQTLEHWLGTFEQHVLPFIDNTKACIIGHSLAPVFILHCLTKYSLALDSAIFVCPFLEYLGRDWQIDLANSSFYKTDFDYTHLKSLIPISYALYSDNDPYVEVQYARKFIKYMGCSPILIRGGKHLGSSAGYSEFPLLLELCKTRIEQS